MMLRPMERAGGPTQIVDDKVATWTALVPTNAVRVELKIGKVKHTLLYAARRRPVSSSLVVEPPDPAAASAVGSTADVDAAWYAAAAGPHQPHPAVAR